MFQRLNSLKSHLKTEAGKLTREMQNITRSGQLLFAESKPRHPLWGGYEVPIVRRTADLQQPLRMKQAATALLVVRLTQ